MAGRAARVVAVSSASMMLCCSGAFFAGGGEDAGDGAASGSGSGAGHQGGGDATALGADADASHAAAEATAEGTTGGGSGSGAPHEAGSACPGGQSCVPAAPPGWSGPVALYAGTSASPGCPAGSSPALQGGSGLTAPPATCSACTCSGAVTCTAPAFAMYGDPECNGSSCATGTATQAACSVAPSTCGVVAVGIQVQSSPSATGCAPSAQNPVTPPVSWSTSATGCAVSPAAACGASAVCVPATSSGVQACIYQPGDASCPPGPYATKQLLFTGVADTRGCSACSCGTPPGATCSGGSILMDPELAQTPTCGSGATVPVPTTCEESNPYTGAPQIGLHLVTPATPSSTKCAPAGGQPTGGAAATAPTTVCCAP